MDKIFLALPRRRLYTDFQYHKTALFVVVYISNCCWSGEETVTGVFDLQGNNATLEFLCSSRIQISKGDPSLLVSIAVPTYVEQCTTVYKMIIGFCIVQREEVKYAYVHVHGAI